MNRYSRIASVLSSEYSISEDSIRTHSAASGTETASVVRTRQRKSAHIRTAKAARTASPDASSAVGRCRKRKYHSTFSEYDYD